MDNDFQLDLNEVVRVIREADVVLLRFTIVQQRLLLDARFSNADGPLLKIVPRVGSARERFRELKQLRPRFPLPERITAIVWPRFIATLAKGEVWNALEQRLAASGFPHTTDLAQNTLQELLSLEHAEIRNAIRGEGYQTQWQRQN
ncbi:MAG: hypothetical protein ACR2PL_20655 [Dehalococcoidia bacterium]